MRIAIEAQRIFRKKKHGMDIVALETIRHLQQIDQENEYYILTKPDEDNTVLNETDNFRIIGIKSAPYPIWEQISLPETIKKIKPDMLHCTSNTAPLKINVPLILTLHDIMYLQEAGVPKGSVYQRLGNYYRRIIVPKIVPDCEKIITVSEYEKNNILNHFSLPSERINVVYNAQSRSFNPAADSSLLNDCRKKYQLPERYLLHIGNTDPRKNLRNVLKAVSILKENGLAMPLVILGISKKYLGKVLAELDLNELSPYIHLPGYIHRTDLPPIYNMASVFLFPSFYEGFGIPIIESMACGVPVITSNATAMPEVAGNSALLIDPGRPGEIAAAVTSLLVDKEKYFKLQEAGLKRAADFSWLKTARAVLGLYEEVYACCYPIAHQISLA